MIRAHDLVERPLLTALIAVTALGAIVLVMTMMPSFVLSGASAAEPRPEIAIPRLPKQALPPLQAYGVISERPLFNAGRVKDPPPPSEEPAKPQLPPISGYRLVGLVVSTDVQRALVTRPSGELASLKPGDNLDGRTVTKIDSRAVTLTADGHEDVLTFPRKGGSAAQVAAAGASSTQANR